jgi:non-specific serine/threonine protein kinase
MKNLLCICFDLGYNETLKHFLPMAYIVKYDSNKLMYVEKIATSETIKSYGIIPNETTLQLIQIAEVLKFEALNKKYSTNKKTKTGLAELIKDKATAKVINQFIESKTQIFLQIAAKNNVPICVNLNREIPFHSQQISFSDVALESKLHFEKKDIGVFYTLYLTNQKTFFHPCEKTVTPILNMPAWVVVDKIMYNLSEINANKLTPFLKKKTVEIDQKNVKVYFQTFIKDIVNKVEIEPVGFDVFQNTEISNCRIVPCLYFITDCYYFDLLFDYHDVTFSFKDTRKLSSQLILEDEIQVIQTKRNFDAEQKWIEKLESLGLKINDYGFFSFDVTHKYQNILLLINEVTSFENKGFVIEDLMVENKKITPHFGIISIQKQDAEDWFDLKMDISCGAFNFNFTKIISHLKQNNPFFELPDGTFFLIPNEWFSKYKPLVDFGKIDQNTISIKKNQFVFLENLSDKKEIVLSKKELNYAPSNNLKANLRNYQTDGVKWLLNHQQNQLGACLADDMGLGKTLQTLAVLQYTKDSLEAEVVTDAVDLFSINTPVNPPLKALIVSPSSLVFNWKNESKKFTPSLKSIIYTGSDRKQIASKLRLYDLVFTSYSIISRDIALFKKMAFRYLILDESQYIKNKNSKIFEAINQIETENKITLSGTPIENSLDDLWSQMQFINPDLLGSYSFFVSYFKNPIQKKKDPKAIEELKKLIQPYILRRTKEQVAKDLPPVMEQVFYTEMEGEQKSLYEKEKSIARNYLLQTATDKPINKLNVLNTLMKLRQLANHPKLVDNNSAISSGKFDDVTQYLDTLIKSNQKILVFSSFVKHISLYTDWCKKQQVPYCLLTGETATENRETEVNEFQNNPQKQLFFISLKAGSVGLNLTQATFVVLLDPWWNPFAENQAIARAHRIGQTKPVNVVRFIAKDTIEEKILSLQQKKKEISDAIIDVDAIPEDLHTNLEFILG